MVNFYNDLDYDNSPGWLEVVSWLTVSRKVGHPVGQVVDQFGRSARLVVVWSVGQPVDLSAVSRSGLVAWSVRGSVGGSVAHCTVSKNG